MKQPQTTKNTHKYDMKQPQTTKNTHTHTKQQINNKANRYGEIETFDLSDTQKS